ncbi:TRAP transporter large permease [uncultured Desulfovibrio sp.]|uniref:TRAP transporter large permease n=1 Tax=uncultured Desulfovibrio sp. TaxID=167968 RepID=UPI002614CF2A|nr:TRAP transporter large permease [uncultured Desulfovibrio sp.]
MEALTPLAIGGLLFVIFFALLLIGAPIMVGLGMATMACFILLDIDLSIMVERAFASLTAFPLMALPAFVLAGALMEASGISRRLVNIAENIVGPIPGGLAISTVLSCVFFGAISGSGPATTAAVGMLMIPAMTRRGYNTAYAAAATSTAGGIGIIIPPSIPMVIYGVTGQVSISKMFMAGFIPGILIAISLCVVHYFRCKDISTAGMSWNARNLLFSLKDGFWSILAPLIILGGIYAGWFTPTEAAVVAIFYTLLVGLFIHRELKLRSIMASLKTTSWLSGRVLVLVFTATSFGFLLTSHRIPNEIATMVLSLTDNVYVVWVFVVLLLVFLGMFMETLAIIMLVTPVLLPIMTSYGVDPIHFGLVLICCCGIGFSTPPLGENMFIASGISNQSLEAISLKAIPMVISNIAAIVVLVIFPDLVLWLPSLMDAAAP